MKSTKRDNLDIIACVLGIVLCVCVVVVSTKLSEMNETIQAIQGNVANHKGLIVQLHDSKAERSEVVSADLKMYDFEQRLKAVEKIK